MLLIIGFTPDKGAISLGGGEFVCFTRLLKVPPVMIGLTIVGSWGRSAPEASVSITAGLSGNNDIGTEQCDRIQYLRNLLVVVLGASAVIRPALQYSDREIMKRDIPVNIASRRSAACFFAVGPGSWGGLRIQFLILLAAYLGMDCRRRGTKERMRRMKSRCCLRLRARYIAVGLAAIIWGGDLVVDSASEIARIFGMSQNLIGLTIVALGTSLPELVTSVAVSRKVRGTCPFGNAGDPGLLISRLSWDVVAAVAAWRIGANLDRYQSVLIAVSAVIL